MHGKQGSNRVTLNLNRCYSLVNIQYKKEIDKADALKIPLFRIFIYISICIL